MRKYLLADEPPKKIAFNVPSWAFVPDDEIDTRKDNDE